MNHLFGVILTAALLTACSAERSSEPDTPDETVDVLEQIADTATVAEDAEFDARSAFPHWFAATEPFQVMDDLYYVGSAGLAVWFIPTSDGHIVIDGGLPQTAPQVIANIRALGHDPADIAILLNTHAHSDHSGGLAELKALSGAQMIASEGDRSALEGGFYLGSEDVSALNAPPVGVDRVIGDGDTVSHGGVTLTASITPGHTRGCTSWTMTLEEAGVAYDALVFCSASVAANRLVDPPQYEGIVEDYRTTFARVADWSPDIFLSNHPEFFAMSDKREALENGDPLAFVDKDGFPAFVAYMEQAFKDDLEAQTAEAAGGN